MPGEFQVLIVEDDPISADLLHKILAPYGNCVMAKDGNVAFQTFKNAWEIQEKPFNLVFLDILLPGLNGQQVLTKMRQFENDRGILGLEERTKIIIISSLKDEKNIADAFHSQVEAYIFKPFHKAKIVSVLQKMGINPANRRPKQTSA